MGNNKICESVIKDLLLFEDLTLEQKIHINSCDSCRAEYDKIAKMNSLVKASAPKKVSLKASVLEKINNENIKIQPETAPKRRHIPIGTLSAAAAVLAVGVLVYKTDILNKVSDHSADKAEFGYEAVYETEPSNGNEQAFLHGSIVYDEESAIENTRPTFDNVMPETFDAVSDSTAEIQESITDPEKLAVKSPTGASGAQNATLRNEAVESETAKDNADSGIDLNAKLASIVVNYSAGSAKTLFHMITIYLDSDITLAEFNEVGDKAYVAFVNSISDFETEYTKQALYDFCENYK